MDLELTFRFLNSSSTDFLQRDVPWPLYSVVTMDFPGQVENFDLIDLSHASTGLDSSSTQEIVPQPGQSISMLPRSAMLT